MPNSSVAILFGVNYERSPDAKLRGCINDVNNMASFLKSKAGYNDVRVFTDEKTDEPTSGRSILRKLHTLARESHRKKLEKVWIHFSGHGCNIKDRSGDENDGLDECILPSDFKTRGIITDNMIKGILRRFYYKTKLTCIFDCCHSGTICDLKYTYDVFRSTSVMTTKYAPCSPKILLISGCMDSQTSADAYNVRGKREFSGAMTSCLLLALEDETDMIKAYKSLYEKIKEKKYSQRPQLTSSYPITCPFMI